MKSRMSVLGALAIAMMLGGCETPEKAEPTTMLAAQATKPRASDYQPPACFGADDMCLNGGDCCSGRCEEEKCL